jgi:creatinine amidohydrolase
MSAVLLEEMTWPEVEAALAAGVDAALIPVGSTEQHGRHLPLNTDTFVAREIALRSAQAAADVGLRVLVTPPLSVTLSWYHMQFPGTLRVSPETFQSTFYDVCTSLSYHGLQNLVVVNGHGGNAAALTVAINRHFELTQQRVVLVQWWDLAVDELVKIEGPLLHAEEAETSIALALGQRVEMTEATRGAFNRGEAVREAGFAWTSLGKYGLIHAGPGVVVPMDMLRDITPSGVVGDATRARRETGEAIVAKLIERVVQVVEDLAGTGS